MKIQLRALEPGDLDFLYQLENDPGNWSFSHTRIPFSRHILKAYIESIKDIYIDKQLRLLITFKGSSCGIIDIFDFDPFHQCAGIGIIVIDEFRRKGVGKAALTLACAYAHDHLGLKNLTCRVLENNLASKNLFETCSFTRVGTLQSWHRDIEGRWLDEHIYQRNLTKGH